MVPAGDENALDGEAVAEPKEYLARAVRRGLYPVEGRFGDDEPLLQGGASVVISAKEVAPVW
jgi:hypothetical protein